MNRYRLCKLGSEYTLLDFTSNRIVWHSGTFLHRHYLLNHEIFAYHQPLTLEQFRHQFPELFI